MTTTGQLDAVSVQLLHDKAAQLRIDSVRATTEAGSGHPTSCASAADIVSVLFFAVMRYDPQNPRRPGADVFVLSKGHAAPLLYAAWAEAGAMPRKGLLSLRKIGSDLEGHPTPRLPFVDVATGSLGQGLSAAAGIAYHSARLRPSGQRVYVLMGDGESAEGSIWEAAQWAAFRGLGNLCATIDINRLGQSQPTMLQHDLTTYRRRWEAFGWNAIPVDGHDIPALLKAYEQAADTTDRPSIVLARTRKGRDLGKEIEDAENWHGKPLPREMAERVVADLEKRITGAGDKWQPVLPSSTSSDRELPGPTEQERASKRPPYQVGGKEIATRRGFGDGLAALAAADPRVVVLDGDVKNSTYTEEFEKAAPNRFLEGYIAEQNMVGMAMGLAARGHVPFASTFACFLTRAYDFIRMAAISNLPVKLVGTHAGVSIGEDGPSQMGLEDLAMMCAEPDATVLYPADATGAWRATWLVAAQPGLCYVRTGRPAAPVLYGPDEPFAIGKCKVLRRGDHDRAVVVAAGVTVAEALKAHDTLRDRGIAIRVIDLFSVKPIDREELVKSAREAGGMVITVEDHYEHGGIGDAVFAALSGESFRGHKLAVREIPRSGKPAELLAKFGIDADSIVSAVCKALV
ncbi:MAG TPA: transketolase [Bryobacteraceae bacterium]|nr:transketolase [Bryobacteraceae bacterium]